MRPSTLELTMRQLIRPTLLTLLFLLTVSTLAACGVLGGGLRTGDDVNNPFNAGDSVYVVCSDTCSAQGQCGITTIEGADGPSDITVVLVNPTDPATRNHGAFVQADQAVTILEHSRQRMVRNVNEETFQMNFYRVQYAPDAGQQVEGWAHGMCIANRALQ